jgi:peptidoglycan/xylan/chitin deacetylase (PgdA/CDA1 family)
MKSKYVYRVLSNPIIQKYFLRRLSGSISVLMYHGIIKDQSRYHAWTQVPVSSFENQIKYLLKNFDLITLDEAICTFKKRDNQKPKAVITFDDGLRNNFSQAFPIIKQYKVPVTVYVSTKAVVTQIPFWWDRVIQAIESSGVRFMDLREFGLKTYSFNINGDTKKFWIQIKCLLDALKNLSANSNKSVVEKLLQCLSQKNTDRKSYYDILSVVDIKQMASSKLVSIGSHSHCHRDLTRLSTMEIKNSITKSINLLQAWTQQSQFHFSYPYGDHNPKVLSVLNQLGIKTAMTADNGRWMPQTDPLKIPRIDIGGYDDIHAFKAKVSGSISLLAKMLMI